MKYMQTNSGYSEMDASDQRPGPAHHDAAPGKSGRVRRNLLQRAVLAWLYADAAPRGVALDVPTRTSKFKADVAAFWSKSVKNPSAFGPGRVLEPNRTMLIQCHTHREECWGNVTRSDGLMPALEKYRRERRELEDLIRAEEPELKDPNTLFEEYAIWHYDRSRNRRYHRVQEEIQRLEHALLKGTRFEQIRSAHVADELYLAVPAYVIDAEELADGWGLLWVHEDLSVELKRQALHKHCEQLNRQHIVQNIAAAAAESVLFKNGIRNPSGKNPYFVKKPGGHLNKKQLGL